MIEVEPSAGFEDIVKNIVTEALEDARIVCLYTQKGSPIYRALINKGGIRFYTMVSSVQYPVTMEASVSYETYLPQNDHPIILATMEELVRSKKDADITLIYDNLSDMIVISGVESTYRFLRQAIEILDSENIDAYFIMVRRAHDDRVFNLIRGLFSTHMLLDESGLRVVKGR